MLKILVVLVAAVCITNAALPIFRPSAKPEKYKDQEGCYIGELDKVIPFGKNASSSSSCARYNCFKGYIQYEICDGLAPSGCLLVYHKGKGKSTPYPDCCPILHCFSNSIIDEEKL